MASCENPGFRFLNLGFRNLGYTIQLCTGQSSLDDRQITHLICVRLRHLLYDFLGGVLGLLPVVFPFL